MTEHKESSVLARFASPLLILATIIWGSSFVVMKSSVDVLPTFWLLAIRFSFAALVLAVGCTFTGAQKSLRERLNTLPEETAAALESALADLGTDCNGDGQVVVQLNQYVMGDNSGEGAVYAYAGSTKLMADLNACESYFFLLEDPEAFQENYQVLRRLDGSLPEETDQDYESCCLSWSGCPVLRELPLGEYTEKILDQEIHGDNQERLATLSVARRGFWTERTCSYSQECDVLWDAITRGSER